MVKMSFSCQFVAAQPMRAIHDLLFGFPRPRATAPQQFNKYCRAVMANVRLAERSGPKYG
jgi:hypothetical protein